MEISCDTEDPQMLRSLPRARRDVLFRAVDMLPLCSVTKVFGWLSLSGWCVEAFQIKTLDEQQAKQRCDESDICLIKKHFSPHVYVCILFEWVLILQIQKPAKYVERWK